jgi:uncharacterized membrane protein YhaH (DUF805 family)
MIRWLSPKGCIGRRTYWWAYLIPVGCAQMVLGLWAMAAFITQMASQMEVLEQLLDNLQARPLGTTEHQAAMEAMQEEITRFDAGEIFWAQFAILLLCIPMLAGAAKRWRDMGQSGWWSLLLLIPGLGFIIFFLLGCLRGRPAPSPAV